MRCIRQTFLHDDNHPGNLILCNGELSGIIDFNRFDWGDSVHDFVKLAYFTRVQSIPFCAGQVHGYFSGEPPGEFWKRYALYCAAAIFSDTRWSHQYEEMSGSAGQVERSERRVRMVVSDHEGFTQDVPAWYRKYLRPDRAGARERDGIVQDILQVSLRRSVLPREGHGVRILSLSNQVPFSNRSVFHTI